jgi:hypothetical protein
MPQLKFMTWNVENVGKTALINENGNQLLSYVAEVILLSGADIVCLQEVTASTGFIVGKFLWENLNKQATVIGGVPVWEVALPPKPATMSQLTDGYLYFWKTSTVTGLLVNNGGQSGLALNYFPNNTNTGAGRAAAYMLFALVGCNPNDVLMVANYHAPSPGSYGSFQGLTSIHDMAENALTANVNSSNVNSFAPELDPNALPVEFVACGDYNVDLANNPDCYNALDDGDNPLEYTAPGPTSLTTIAHAYKTDACLTATSTEPFLANAYDNFLYTYKNKVELQGAELFDTITNNLPTGQTTGPLAPFLEGFFANGAASFSGAAQYCPNPPTNYFQSFVFQRGAISDHMPVVGTFNINFS